MADQFFKNIGNTITDGWNKNIGNPLTDKFNHFGDQLADAWNSSGIGNILTSMGSFLQNILLLPELLIQNSQWVILGIIGLGGIYLISQFAKK